MQVATNRNSDRYPTGPWMLTNSGKRFDPFDPQPDQIDLHSIATGLSKLCRFSGQCNEFYSVAQHSVLCTRLVPEEDRATALMHDATEAYLADLPKPIKDFLPGYEELEAKLWTVIAHKYDLPEILPTSVKQADRIMLMTEKRDLMPDTPEGESWGYDNVGPAPWQIRCLTPKGSEMAFWKRVSQYGLSD